MNQNEVMLACPNCGKRDGEIVSESLGIYTRCWSCGLTLGKHFHDPDYNKREREAVEYWNNLSRRVIPPDEAHPAPPPQGVRGEGTGQDEEGKTP